MKETEIWKSVKGFEGLYEVSNFGRIRNVPHWTTREYFLSNGIFVKNKLFVKQVIINPKIKKHVKNGYELNYLGVSLRKDKKYYNKLIHRLVAEAFIPNTHNYPIINHIDCNPQNNHVSNLEWCDYKHNNIHSNRIDKSRRSYLNNPNNRKPITLMDSEYNIIYKSSGINDLLEKYPSFNRNSIYNCISKNKLYKKKYRFCYTLDSDTKLVTFTD